MRALGRWCRRILRRIVQCAFLLCALYAAVVLVGLIPVNNDFQPTPSGVEILLVSRLAHADVVLPVAAETIDWRGEFPPTCFAGDVRGASHVAIGWGDRKFFLETPTWADLRYATAVRALAWPSESCLHVQFLEQQPAAEDIRRVQISAAEYEQLVAYVRSGLKRGAAGSSIPIEDAAYGPHDAFFEARGRYHALNTCNSWVGGAMRAAGIRTGWLTPLPKTVFLWLPSSFGE